MMLSWVESRRKALRIRAHRKSVTLKLELLESRLLPTSVLDLYIPSFGAGGVALYTGGSVGPMTTAQAPGEVAPVHENYSGSLDAKTTFTYALDVNGTAGNDGFSSYRQAYSYTFDTTSTTPDGTLHESGTYHYVFTVTSSASESQFTLVADLSYQLTGSQTAQTTGADGATTATTTNRQQDRTSHREIRNHTNLASGASASTDVGVGVATQSHSTSGTYSYPVPGGTVSGVVTQNGQARTDYSYTVAASQGSIGPWSFTGNGTINATGEGHLLYSDSSSYSSAAGNSTSHGSIMENGSDNTAYQSTLTLAQDTNGNWMNTAGSASSQGSGTYVSSYSGSNSNVVHTTSATADSSSDSTLNESEQASGNGSASYNFATSSALVNGAWVTNGSAVSHGSRTTASSDAVASTLDQTFASSWSDSASSGSSSSSLHRAETFGLTQNSSYEFSDSVTLSADGSIAATTTTTANSSSSGYNTLIASGVSDYVNDTTNSSGSNHEDSHQTQSQAVNEQFTSSWLGSFTTVTGYSGSLTTGSVSGTTTATGTDFSVASGHGASNSTFSGAGYSSQSNSDWSSAVNSQDACDYQANWSEGFDAYGMPTSTFSDNNHATGSFARSDSSHWFTSSTLDDLMGGVPITTSANGGSSTGTSTSYDTSTGSTPGNDPAPPATIQYFPLGMGLVLGQAPANPAPPGPWNWRNWGTLGWAGIRGAGDGFTMVGNAVANTVTLGNSPLNNYVDNLIQQNGGGYRFANGAANVGVVAAETATGVAAFRAARTAAAARAAAAAAASRTAQVSQLRRLTLTVLESQRLAREAEAAGNLAAAAQYQARSRELQELIVQLLGQLPP